MPATDTLRSPQAKTTFRASVSFLILMVLSMREAAGLCSAVIICKTQRNDRICQFLYSQIFSQYRIQEKWVTRDKLCHLASPLDLESFNMNKKRAQILYFLYFLYFLCFLAVNQPPVSQYISTLPPKLTTFTPKTPCQVKEITAGTFSASPATKVCHSNLALA